MRQILLRAVFVSGATLHALMMAGPAYGCSLPVAPLFEPPPGMTQLEGYWWQQKKVDEWKREQTIWVQQRLWNDADAVMLARVEARPMSTIVIDDQKREVRDVELRPVRWLKGEGSTDTFRVGPQGIDSCGLYPYFDAMEGEPGDVFVVYVRGGPPSQKTVRDALAIPNIHEPRALAALKQDQ